RPPGNALGATLRSRTANDERRADRGRGLGCLRTHRRYRRVLDVGCRSADLSGGPSADDTADVVRSVRESARHAWIVRTDWADEPPFVARRPSRGCGTLT